MENKIAMKENPPMNLTIFFVNDCFKTIGKLQNFTIGSSTGLDIKIKHKKTQFNLNMFLYNETSFIVINTKGSILIFLDFFYNN